MHTLTIDVPGPLWVTSNDRLHWAARAKRTRMLRRLAKSRAREQRLPRGLARVRVTVDVHGRTRGRMDPANVYPAVKAVIDGLTDYGVWVDDDADHLIGPDMRRGTPIPSLPTGWHRLTITITKEEQ